MDSGMIKIGEGMLSKCFLADENTVLLVGKREDSFESYQRTKENLENLRGKIKSVEIPRNPKLVAPCKEYPLGALYISRVRGEKLSSRIRTCTRGQKIAIGKKLAEFILELQACRLPGDKAAVIKRVTESYAQGQEALQPYLSVNENKLIAQFAGKYKKFLHNSDFHTTHGDLFQENMFVNDRNELVSVIDFDTEYFAAEIEFAPIYEYDKTIFGAAASNFKGKISIRNVKLALLARQVRFFRHAVTMDEDTKQKELTRIKNMLETMS